jgi:hypothetical protein
MTTYNELQKRKDGATSQEAIHQGISIIPPDAEEGVTKTQHLGPVLLGG